MSSNPSNEYDDWETQADEECFVGVGEANSKTADRPESVPPTIPKACKAGKAAKGTLRRRLREADARPTTSTRGIEGPLGLQTPGAAECDDSDDESGMFSKVPLFAVSEDDSDMFAGVPLNNPVQSAASAAQQTAVAEKNRRDAVIAKRTADEQVRALFAGASAPKNKKKRPKGPAGGKAFDSGEGFDDILDS